MGHPHQVQHHRRLGLFDSAPGQWQTGCHAPTPRLFRRTSQPQHSHWPRTSMSPSSFSSACDHSLPVFTADGSSSPSAVADRGSKCRPKDMSRRDGSSPRSRTSCCWSAAFIVRGDRRQPHGSFLTPRWREMDSNPRSHLKEEAAELHRFDSAGLLSNARVQLGGRASQAPDEVGPRVRIRLPPAASLSQR